MKTQNDILSVLSTLRDYLEEAHCVELNGGHGGDGAIGCSYCAAIAEADSILAASSSPDDSPALPAGLFSEMSDFIRRMAVNALPGSSGAAREEAGKLFARLLASRGAVPAPASHRDKLADFGAWVLSLLQESEEWDADTLQEICGAAVFRRLAAGDQAGNFAAVVPVAEAAPPRSVGASILSFICYRLFDGGEMPLSDERLPGGFSLRSALDAWRNDNVAAPASPAGIDSKLFRDLAEFAEMVAAGDAFDGSSREEYAKELAERVDSSARVLALRASALSPTVEFPALLIYESGGEVLSVDLVRSAEELRARELSCETLTGGNISAAVVPLAQVLCGSAPGVLLHTGEFRTDISPVPLSLSPAPAAVLAEIVPFEASRCGMTLAEMSETFQTGIFGYAKNYMTDSPGFVGEVVVCIWPAAPEAITSWRRAPGGAWEFNAQTSW